MKRMWIVGVVLFAVGLCGSWQLFGEPPAQIGGEDLKPFMHQKLEHSKNILEALVNEDFEKLAKNAQDLSLLSNESNWNVITTMEYMDHSVDFRRACAVIRDAAKEKNVDRATLGFVSLTTRCVECHKYVRKNANK